MTINELIGVSVAVGIVLVSIGLLIPIVAHSWYMNVTRPKRRRDW